METGGKAAGHRLGGTVNTAIRGRGMWQRRKPESGPATTGTSSTGSDNTEIIQTTRLDTKVMG